MTMHPVKILGIIAINIIVILLSPLILTIIAIFIFLRISIDIYLRSKHGKSYGGLLSGADCLWHTKNRNAGIINIALIITTKSKNLADLLRDVKMSIQENIFKQSDKYPKFTSGWEDCLGYGYLLKNQCKLDECVYKYPYDEDIADDYVDKKYLINFISEMAEKPLHHKAMWEFILIPKPIKLNHNHLENGSTQFAMVLRLSHSFGDGFTITAAIINALTKDKQTYAKEFDEMVNKILPKSNQESSFWKKMAKLLNSTCLFIYASCLFVPINIHDMLIRRRDKHSLHGPDLTSKKHLVFAVEHEEAMVDVIKDIKKHQPGASFANVTLTALSASLHQYFQKVSTMAPKSVQMSLMVKLSKPKIELEQLQRHNDFTFITLNLPIDTRNTFIERFIDVKNSLNYPTRFPELMVNRFMMNYISPLLPWYLARLVANIKIFTGYISIVPSIKKLISRDEFNIQDIIFFIPQMGKAGINFSCLTYNGRLQVGLSVDQVLIPNVSDAQCIVDSFMENIRQLHQEVAI